MKNLNLMLLTVLCLLGNKAISQDTLDWTLLVYLVGSDLESGSDAGTTDIQEMMDADFTDYVNVIVLRGGSLKEGWQEPKTYLITAGEQLELDFVPPDTDMANPDNITSFINWATTEFPAYQFMLDFWNHGGDIRGYGFDEISGKNLKVQTIKKAIGDSEFIKNGNRFEILGFDACLMATLEVQTSLKDFTKFFVGSEETEPGHGWNYTPIVNAMESGEALTGDKLGIVVVDSYKAQSENQETSNVTLGVMNLGYISQLEDKLTILFNRLVTENKLRTLQRARGKAEEYSKAIQNPEYSEDMVDIGDMMKILKEIDPTLSPEIDSVLVALDSTVVYNKKDETRPLATGISMYLPHNVLVDLGETEYLIDSVYIPLGFDSTLSEFLVSSYIPAAISDNTAPSGMTDPNFSFSGRKKGSSTNRNFESDSVSAIIIEHDNDLEQVQVVLIEEFEGFPNEYIFLGASYPDTVVYNDDGTETYAYKWDGAWLGINGYPAYISDLQDYEVEDENGNVQFRTRVHIPAILHPNTSNERDIILSYSYDEDFNITLESIVPEVNEEERIVSKERIQLVPGDEVQLLYESFNEVTDEEFFVVDEGAIFAIENGNEDLMLEYDALFEGNYKLGYILMDHSQNDTIIFDDKIFTVLSSSVDESFIDNDIKMFPNPANQEVTIEHNLAINRRIKVRIYDQMGRLVFSKPFNSTTINIDTKAFADGYYRVQLISGSSVYGQGLIIQKD